MSISSTLVPNRRLTLPAIVLSLAVILYVPYLCPQQPSASDSYIFGYNNRVGVSLLLLLSLAGAIWTRGCSLDLHSTGRTKNVSFRVLSACLGTTLVGCVTMNLFAGRFGGLIESSYEIDRVWLLSLGKIPYIDFEWPFGVGLLYGPLWFAHLLHLSIPQGYYFFWTMASIIGIVLLFVTVNMVSYPSERKTSIFLLLYAGTLTSIVGMGTHYTMLRYALPLLSILILHKVGTRDGRLRTQFSAVGLALCFTACLLLISPETAIAHAFACLVIFFPRKSAISLAAMQLYSYFLLVIGLILLLELAQKLHVLDTIFASGGGADSFPIPFAGSVLFFFCVVFLCVCAIVRRWSQPTLQDNSIVLIVLSVPMLAAALGRCDPGHIFFNGIGFFLAASFYASSTPRLWNAYRVGFIVFMIALPAVSTALFFESSLGWVAFHSMAEDALPGHSKGITSKLAEMVLTHMPSSSQKTKGLERLRRIQTLNVPERINFSALYPGIDLSRSDGTFQAPLGYKPNSIGSYLSERVDYGYYEGLENANTPAAVGRKINELATHDQRFLLLREGFDRDCEVDVQAERHEMGVLFFFPYIARASHPVSVHKPICDFIFSHYILEQSGRPENFGYELWIPKFPNPSSR